MTDAVAPMDVTASPPTAAPDKSSPPASHPPPAAAVSNGSVDASAAAPAPATSPAWPPVSSLLLSLPVSSDDWPYVTWDEGGEESGDDDDDEHWLDVAFASTSAFASTLTPRPTPPTALSAALQQLQRRHRAFAEEQALTSPAWQSLKAQTARYLQLCEQARQQPLSLRTTLSAADVGQLDSHTAAALNPLLTPRIPPLPPLPRPISSPRPPAHPSTLPVATVDSNDISRRKRRRVEKEQPAASPLSPSQRLLVGPLGSAVPQLLHIAQLKEAITRQHRSQLRTAIAEQLNNNANILQQQQRTLAARQQQQQQQQPAPPLPLSSEPITSPSAAAAPSAPAARAAPPPLEPSSSPLSDDPSRRPALTAALGPFRDLLAHSPAQTGASPPSPSSPSTVYSEAQLLSLLPSLLAVHFLHCGFTSFSHSALQVMAEATMDFIRRAGKAARHFKDQRRRPTRTPRPKQEKGVKQAPHSSGRGVGVEEKAEEEEDEQSSEEALRHRVLHRLGMGSERELRRWYDERVGGAASRLKRTELRLMSLQQRLSAEGADPFHISLSVVGADARAAMFSCEPFSPLHSLLDPPTLPAPPKPLEEVKEEPPPLDPQVKQEPGTSAAVSPATINEVAQPPVTDMEMEEKSVHGQPAAAPPPPPPVVEVPMQLLPHPSEMPPME